ncbi:MAG: ABC transporter substrate-binding protein [Proteobacteria bacterium]|nr:ABC transporter substrate-binding protein [Pseudomonadota bacterium]
MTRPGHSGGPRRSGAAILLVALLLAPPAAAAEAPARVVSLNLCADQLVLLLARPGQVAALSHLARDSRLSAYANEAKGFPAVAPAAEEVVRLAPDLVIAGRYSLRPTVELLRRFRIAVLEIDLARSFAELRDQLLAVGRALGRGERAREIADGIDASLARIGPQSPAIAPTAILYHPNGFTMGRGTLADEVLARAGFANLAARLGIEGYGRLSLERLIAAHADVLVTEEESREAPSLASEVLAHPALRKGGRTPIRMALPGALWACASPATVEAVTRLAEARARLSRGAPAP